MPEPEKNTMEEPLKKDAVNFLLEDYKLKTDYLNQHFNRMWTRFSFFIAAEVGLLGFFFSLKSAGSGYLAPQFFIWSGIIISALWYMTGAQDKWLVECYRDTAKNVGMKISSHLELKDYTPVGKTKGIKVKNGISQWRCEPLSITRLTTTIPILLTVFWAGLLI
jgi:hypothetical protein